LKTFWASTPSSCPVNYDNNQHSANENIRIGHLWEGIETQAALLMME
jgi:hypothetical protein